MVPTNSTPRWRDTGIGNVAVRVRDRLVTRHSVDRLLVATAAAALVTVVATRSGVDLTAPLPIALLAFGAVVVVGSLAIAITDEQAARRVRAEVALQTELDNVDLHGARLRGAYLRQRSLRSARLSNADLRRADLAASDLTDARLTEADLAGVNLTGATLAGAGLFRVRAHGGCFDGADLSAASLDRADLRRARFHRSCLVQTSLRAADLRGADLREAEFWGADLRGADLRMADLREADLTGANLRGADLRGAKVDGIIADTDQLGAARGGANVPVEHDDAVRLPTPVIELRPQPEPTTGSVAAFESRRRVAAGALAVGAFGLAVAGGLAVTDPGGGDATPSVLAEVQERTSLAVEGADAVELSIVTPAGTTVERLRLPVDVALLDDHPDATAVRVRSLDGTDVSCTIDRGTRRHRSGAGLDVTCLVP